MPANIAPTAFQTSIDDSVAAVDVYTQTTASAPTDSTTSAATNDPQGITSFIGADAASAVSTATSGSDVSALSLTPAEVKSSVISTNSDLLSSFSTLDPSLQTQLCTASGLSSNLLTDTLATPPTSTVSSVSSSANLTGISGLLDVVGGKTKGMLSVANVSAQSTFLSNLVSVSARLNIPNAFSRIVAGGFSAQVMGPVLKAAVTATVSTSSVNLLVDVANNTATGAVKAVFPTFAASFAANFKLGTGTNPLQHAQIGLTVSSALGKIDANWANTTAGGRTMVNAGLFTQASADFKMILTASATLSRSPMKTAVTVTAGVAASTIPPVASLPPAVLNQTGVSSLGQPTTTFVSPDGTVVQFTPNATTPTLYDKTVTAPRQSLTTDTPSIDAVNTSALVGSLAAPAAFTDCFKQAQADSTSNISPALDASTSFNANFPYTTLTGLPVLA